jgi:hypothetical protein
MNFFTVRYTGNPLVTSGGARQKHADLRQIMLLENLMQAQRDAQGIFAREKDSLVARSWELLKMPANGEPQVLQKGVLSFDLYADGSMVYTDGRRIFLLHRDGTKSVLGKDQLISQVLALPTV